MSQQPREAKILQNLFMGEVKKKSFHCTEVVCDFISYLNQIIVASYHHGEHCVLEGCGAHQRVQTHLKEMAAVPLHLGVVHDRLLVVVLEIVAGVGVEVNFMKASMPHRDRNLVGDGVYPVNDRSAHLAMEVLVITPSYQELFAGSALLVPC